MILHCKIYYVDVSYKYCKSTNFVVPLYFGEFGELHVFANICCANIRKLR